MLIVSHRDHALRRTGMSSGMTWYDIWHGFPAVIYSIPKHFTTSSTPSQGHKYDGERVHPNPITRPRARRIPTTGNHRSRSACDYVAGALRHSSGATRCQMICLSLVLRITRTSSKSRSQIWRNVDRGPCGGHSRVPCIHVKCRQYVCCIVLEVQYHILSCDRFTYVYKWHTWYAYCCCRTAVVQTILRIKERERAENENEKLSLFLFAQGHVVFWLQKNLLLYVRISSGECTAVHARGLSLVSYLCCVCYEVLRSISYVHELHRYTYC